MKILIFCTRGFICVKETFLDYLVFVTEVAELYKKVIKTTVIKVHNCRIHIFTFKIKLPCKPTKELFFIYHIFS